MSLHHLLLREAERVLENGHKAVLFSIAAANTHKTGERARRASRNAQLQTELLVVTARLLGRYPEDVA